MDASVSGVREPCYPRAEEAARSVVDTQVSLLNPATCAAPGREREGSGSGGRLLEAQGEPRGEEGPA